MDSNYQFLRFCHWHLLSCQRYQYWFVCLCFLHWLCRIFFLDHVIAILKWSILGGSPDTPATPYDKHWKRFLVKFFLDKKRCGGALSSPPASGYDPNTDVGSKLECRRLECYKSGFSTTPLKLFYNHVILDSTVTRTTPVCMIMHRLKVKKP